MTFCVWFLSFNIMFSRFIYSVSYFIPPYGRIIFISEGTTICLSVDGCFCLLAVANSTAVNKHVRVPQSI